MANRLEVAKVFSIKALHAEGWSQRRIARDLSCDTKRRLHQLIVRDAPAHKSNAERGLGIDDISREQQLGGPLSANQLRQSSQPGRVAAKPTNDEQLTELGVLRGDTDVGHERKLHAPAHRRAIDRSNHRDIGIQQCFCQRR